MGCHAKYHLENNLSICGKEFEKQLVLTNSMNVVEFLDEVSLWVMLVNVFIFFISFIIDILFLVYLPTLWSLFRSWLTLEKLQVVATTPVESIFKLQWLH
jgi:hypothetical protein